MSRASKRAVIVAAAIALSLVLAGSALAVTVFQPTVSLTATSHNNHITAQGVYDNVSHECKGPGGRPVLIHVSNGLSTQTKTHKSGSYSKNFGPFANGHYTVDVTVPGEVRGGYGRFVACLDAHASARVWVHRQHEHP